MEEVILIKGNENENSLVARYEPHRKFILWEISNIGEEQCVGSIESKTGLGLLFKTDEKYDMAIHKHISKLLNILNQHID